MGEEYDLIDILTFSKWDGTYKHFTRDCKECPYYRIIGEANRCYWGIA